MKTGRTILSTVIIFLLYGLSGSCSAQSSGKVENTEIIDEQMVNVYYFHFTRRCVTCLALEEQARLAVESLYPYEIEEGLISFEAVNIEEKSGEKGEEKIDLTSEGFLYSTYNPQKLRQVLKEKIDPLLFQ